MEVHWLLIILFEVLLLYTETSGYETCKVGGEIRYCDNGCCTVGDLHICCLTTYMIIGIVFGCIGAVCSIASVIFCIIQQKKRSGQVISQPTRVMVVSSQNNSTVQSPDYPSTKPLPPGYSSYYYPNNQSGLPPYGASSQPQPPPYSYSSPATNPFKAAALADANNSSNRKS